MQKVENEKRLYGVKMPTDVSGSRETINIIVAPSEKKNFRTRQDVGRDRSPTVDTTAAVSAKSL